MCILRRVAAVVIFCLAATCVIAQTNVSDIWSFWRFQIKKGFYQSLLETLEDFQSVTVFDAQRKKLLHAHLIEMSGQREQAKEELQKARDEFPLLADYADFRLIKLDTETGSDDANIADKAEGYLDFYPYSAFRIDVQHLAMPYLYRLGRCPQLLEYAEQLEKHHWILTAEDQQEDEWLRANCEMKAGQKGKAYLRLKKLWVNALSLERADSISKLIKAMGQRLTASDIFDRARVFRKRSQYTEALKLVNTEISENDCRIECQTLRASLLFANKDYKLAVQAYQKLYQQVRAPNHLYLSCRSLTRAGDYEAGLKCYEQLDTLKLSPTLRLASAFYRASLYIDMDDYPAAQKFFERVSDSRSESFAPRALWTLGWIHWNNQRFEESLRYFRRLEGMTKQGLEKGEGAYWAARTLYKMGRTREAIDTYQRVQREGPLSYYGVLAQNRVDELVPDAEKNSTTDRGFLTRFNPLPQENADREFLVHFSTTELRTYFLQIKALSEIGLIEDARRVMRHLLYLHARQPDVRKVGSVTQFLVNRLVHDNKLPHTLMLQLLLMVQDYYNVIQLAYTRLGYDQSRFPDSEKEAYLWNMLYPRPYQAWIEPLSKQYHLTPYLLWAIMRSESMFREQIVSQAGAIGLLQVMPNTGTRLAEKLQLRNFSTDQLYVPYVNILLSSRYLHDLLYKMDGNLAFTVAAYNAGPHRVRRWMEQFRTQNLDEFIERIPFVETREYIMKNIQHLAAYTYLYHPKDPRFRVANNVHTEPNPLLDSNEERWDYDLLY